MRLQVCFITLFTVPLLASTFTILAGDELYERTQQEFDARAETLLDNVSDFLGFNGLLIRDVPDVVRLLDQIYPAAVGLSERTLQEVLEELRTVLIAIDEQENRRRVDHINVRGSHSPSS